MSWFNFYLLALPKNKLNMQLVLIAVSISILKNPKQVFLHFKFQNRTGQVITNPQPEMNWN